MKIFTQEHVFNAIATTREEMLKKAERVNGDVIKERAFRACAEMLSELSLQLDNIERLDSND